MYGRLPERRKCTARLGYKVKRSFLRWLRDKLTGRKQEIIEIDEQFNMVDLANQIYGRNMAEVQYLMNQQSAFLSRIKYHAENNRLPHA